MEPAEPVNTTESQNAAVGYKTAEEWPASQSSSLTQIVYSNNSVESRESETTEVYQHHVRQRRKQAHERIPAPALPVFTVFHERHRQITFDKILKRTTKITQKLAGDGGYLENTAGGALLKCAFCDLNLVFEMEMTSSPEIVSSLQKDHIYRHHCRHMTGQHCQSRVGTYNIPDVNNEQNWKSSITEVSDSLEEFEQELGINPPSTKEPELAVYERRVSTFLTLPSESRKHSDEDLANSGYYYKGDGDSISCFSCGIVSSDLESGECLWVHHVRSSPRCLHLIYQKDQEFIDDVVARYGLYKKPEKANRIHVVTVRMLRPRWDADPVQRAITFGLPKEIVKTVVIDRIKKGEPDFRNLTEIVKAVNDQRVPTSVLASAATSSSLLLNCEVISPPTVKDCVEELIREIKQNNVADEPMDETNGSEEAPKMENIISLAQQTKAQLTCKICLADIVGIINIPCGHLVSCVTCSAAVSACPICRKKINGTIKVKFP